MGDLSFVDRIDEHAEECRARRDHRREVLHEGLRQKIKHLQNDGEQALDYARDLKRANGDVSEELNEMEAHAKSMLLMVGVLRGDISKA